MKELQLVLSDDLIYTQSGERVPADETVIIALDGKTRELDLTAENAKELRGLLSVYMEAGHIPGTPVPNPTEPAYQRKPTPALIEARAKFREIRDWADSQGLTSDDGQRPIWKTASGGYYYSEKLMQLWRAHLRTEARRNLPGA